MNNIQKLRKLYKKTQDEISDVIMYAKPLYAAFEHGKIPLPQDRLKILADYFNVSEEYLLGDENE